MNKTSLLAVSLGFLSSTVFSGTMGSIEPSSSNSGLWSVTASLGYSVYQGMFSADGQTAIGRLALGRTLFAGNRLTFGIEAGVQNGKTMRLDAPQATLDELGGLPIQSTLNPMLDLLATVKTAPWGASSVYGQLKGGIAYRHWQFDNRDSINDPSQVAGEIQAGIGYAISSHAGLSLSYQGVFGGNPDFKVNALNQTGHVSTIPMQNGVLLGLSLTV